MISIIGEPCPIFSAAPGGVSGQPGNNGSYAPALVVEHLHEQTQHECSQVALPSETHDYCQL